MTSSRIISEKFTAFDTWPFGTRRLCIPCAWAYTRRPTTQQTTLITADNVTEYPDTTQLAPILMKGPLPNTSAAIVPTAKHRHLLPTAQWGHLATEGIVVRWDAPAAQRLADLSWLRTAIGATWPQLKRPAPPPRLLTSQPADRWAPLLTAWERLQPWRRLPPLWIAVDVLTATPTPPHA